MKILVCCGSYYKQEVEAQDHISGVAAAFHIKLPLSIGEVIRVRDWNTEKSKWEGPRFMWAASVLGRIGATHLYVPGHRKDKLVLDTSSPDIRRIVLDAPEKPGEEKPSVEHV